MGLIMALWFLGGGGVARGQQGQAIKGYTVTQYYPAPNFKQLQMKFTGAEAVQIPGAGKKFRVTQPHFMSYRPTGESEVLIDTPECIFDDTDPKARVINSVETLSMRTGTGDFSITGRGFLLRLDSKTLIISNDVVALVRYTNTAPPLVITSRWFQFDLDLRRGVFYDDVRAADTNQVLTCAWLTILGSTNKNQPTTLGMTNMGRGGLELIEAEGGMEVVGISRPGFARAKRGIFRQAEQRMDLIGDAKWEFEGRSGEAERFTIWQKGEEVDAHGKVRLTAPRKELDVADNLLGRTNTTAKTSTAKTSATNTVTIFAEHVTKRGDQFLADGNVRITDGTNELTCAKLEGRHPPKQPQEGFAAATGGVFVGREGGGIHSDRADYSGAKEEILFTGNPRLLQGEINGTAGRLIVNTKTGEVRAEENVAVQFPAATGSGNIMNLLPGERTNRVATAKSSGQKAAITAQTFRLLDRRGWFTGDVRANQLPIDGSESRMRARELEILLAADKRHPESLQARDNVVCERGTIGVTNGPAEYSRMDCATLTAQADPATGELKQLIADGGVDLQQTLSRAQGRKAVYTHTDQLLRLIGSPRIERPEGVYTSEEDLKWDNALQKVSGKDFKIKYKLKPEDLKDAVKSEKLF